jgi:Mrp family chromosome partitioning ATPase
VQRSKQALMDVGAKVLGVVLNRVNLRSADYHYSYRYYSTYYNKDDEKAEPNYVATQPAPPPPPA